MSRLKLCLCVCDVLWGDELEYVWLGYWQQVSACFFLSLCFILFFAYIVDDGSDVHIVVFFIEIIYCFMASFSQWPHG